MLLQWRGLVLAMLICVGTVCVGQSSHKDKSEEQRLRQLQQEWINAYLKGDVQTVSNLEAEDYTAADETGLISKKEQIEGIKKRQPSDMHMTFHTDDWNVRFYGPVALVTCTATDRSSEPGKEPVHLIATTVWTKHAGQWRVDHIQYSQLQAK